MHDLIRPCCNKFFLGGESLQFVWCLCALIRFEVVKCDGVWDFSMRLRCLRNGFVGNLNFAVSD